MGPLAILLATRATVSQSSFDDALNALHIQRQAVASRPDGPWLPLVFMAAK